MDHTHPRPPHILPLNITTTPTTTAPNIVHLSSHLLVFTATSVFMIGIVGTVGNLLAVMSLRMNKKLQQSPSTSFMVNLPACLLPVCLLGMPMYGIGCLYLLYHREILFPEWLRVLTFVVGLMLSQVHLHTICAIAFNRLLAVMWPQVYKKVMLKRRVRIYLGLLWLYSAVLWFPSCFGWFGQLKFKEEELMVTLEASRAIRAVHTFFTFFLPILITGICYLIMYIKMNHSKRSREVKRHRKSSVEDTLKQWDDQVTRTILIIFLILVSCNVPHIAIHVVHIHKPRPVAWIVLHVIFWLQFCLDPVVYVVSSQQYRQAAREFLKRLLYPYFSSLTTTTATATATVGETRSYSQPPQQRKGEQESLEVLPPASPHTSRLPSKSPHHQGQRKVLIKVDFNLRNDESQEYV